MTATATKTADLKTPKKTVTVEWSEVKRAFTAIVEDGKLLNQPLLAQSSWHSSPYRKDSWEGGSASQTMEWIRQGYRAPEFEHALDHAVSDKITVAWSDEDGEPDAGKLLGGDDNFFFAMESRPAKPAISMDVEYSFSASVNHKTILKYGEWVAGYIGALEAEGYDLEVNLVYRGEGIFQSGGLNEVKVRVKRIGELSDFTEWSALFSPTGWRQLYFTAMAVAADKGKDKIQSHLGMPKPFRGAWDIVKVQDAEGERIRICVDNRDSDCAPALNKAAQGIHATAFHID